METYVINDPWLGSEDRLAALPENDIMSKDEYVPIYLSCLLRIWR